MSNTSHQASTLFDQQIYAENQHKHPITKDLDTSASTQENDFPIAEASDDSSVESGKQPDEAPASADRLVPEARRAMIRLMRQGVITSKNHSRLFNCLCRHQALIQDHLANMYLKMMLDPQYGIALLQEQESEDIEHEEDEPVSLISRRTLTLYDTLLLLVLRRYYQDREKSGEQQVFIDTEQIESLLTPFLPLTNSSRSDRRNLNGALEKVRQRKIISGSKDSERFEITPVIRYVVNADFLHKMLDSYTTMSGQIQNNSQQSFSEEGVNND
ncbi:DUF4194 domain-containing protein [Endozoicomonas sp. Mp262]|uniref:DUF4194 domain-containing protein n=1 Tax=Endozoicomonas sp. Mp262 TaxID=2919499 RepID=UPI0021D8B68B